MHALFQVGELQGHAEQPALQGVHHSYCGAAAREFWTCWPLVSCLMCLASCGMVRWSGTIDFGWVTEFFTSLLAADGACGSECGSGAVGGCVYGRVGVAAC